MSENLHLESGYLNASTKKRPKDIGIKYQKSIHENELTPEVQGGQLLTMAANQNALKKSEERVKEFKENKMNPGPGQTFKNRRSLASTVDEYIGQA